MSADAAESDHRSAEARASDKIEFFDHLGAYIVVMGVLAYISLSGHQRRYWFLWVLVGWGIGVVRNGLRAYGYKGRLVRRLIDREHRRARHG